MDYYQIILTALHYFFTKVGCDFQANWVADDLLQWEKEKNVAHHLEAFKGGMGSVFNDLFICVQNKHNITHEQEVWANRIFGVLTNFSYYFATKNSKGKRATPDDMGKNSWRVMHIEGCRCLDCGYALIPKSSVDYYICPLIIENVLLDSLKQNNLMKSIDKILSLDLPDIKIQTEMIIKLLYESKINYIEEPYRMSMCLPSWIMRPCTGCGSNNTVVYRWTRRNNEFVPAKNNLKLSKKARKRKDNLQ